MSTSIRCPACKATETTVTTSRPLADKTGIRRRRQCDACGHRFTTYEAEVHHLTSAEAAKILGELSQIAHDLLHRVLTLQQRTSAGDET